MDPLSALGAAAAVCDFVFAITAALNTIKAKDNTIKATVNTIKATVNTIKATVDTIKAKDDTIKATVDAIKATVDTIKATVDIALLHDLEGAIRKKCDTRHSTVFRPRSLLPRESQPRSGRIMTFGYNAGMLLRKWDNSKAPKFDDQILWGSGTSLTAQDTGDIGHSMDRPTQSLDRGIGGKIGPSYTDKHNEAFRYLWGRQWSQHHGTDVAPATDEAIYTSQDEVLTDIYQVSLEQAIDHDSPTRAACSKYRKLAARYLRLHTAMKSSIFPAVFLAGPTVVSAAAVPMRCNLCSGESAQLDWDQSSNLVLMFPSPPGRQVLQYLAFCSVTSVLVYFQRTGPYLKHSFLVFSGLLGLICVAAGTETMLKFLPLVGLVTLLASWVCQVLTKVIRALRPYEVRDEPVATTGCTIQEVGDKNPKSLVT